MKQKGDYTLKKFAPEKPPVKALIERQGVVVLDGGLATELERMGYDLDHPLWSARVLLSDPDAIRQVHLSYLRAGADLITTASYQVSFRGCINEGMSEKEVDVLLRKTVNLAIRAREEFLKDKSEDRIIPLIGAGIGPYGACLADGSEYTGDYGISKDELHDFHIKRWEVLATTNADLMACETIPSYREAEVLLNILKRTPGRFAYFSFSCRDGEHISDGTPLKACAELLADCKQVIAVGINCTAPRYISSLIEKVRSGAPDKAVVVYPNSGETYNAGSWSGTSGDIDPATSAKAWFSAGAMLIGGCCRTRPAHIKAIREALIN